jgi:hypothetical protein
MNSRKTSTTEQTPLSTGSLGQAPPSPNGEDKPVAPSGEAAAPVATPATADAKPKTPIKLTAARLRMDPANETMGTARKLLTRVPVLPKPDPQWFVQTHPDPAFRVANIGILEYNRDRRLYPVDPSLSEVLKSHYRKHYIFTACSKGNAVFLWVIKMPGDDGSWNPWPSSLHGCALACANEWLQVTTGAGCYDIKPAEDYHPPPAWKDLLYPCTTMDELIAIAFRQTYLDGEDHPVVLDLLGRKQP